VTEPTAAYPRLGKHDDKQSHKYQQRKPHKDPAEMRLWALTVGAAVASET